MLNRCNNPNVKSYKDYGERGIVVCQEWNDFMSFYSWSINNGYAEDLTIDRIDNEGNYEPKNCRWTTKTVQSNNRRSNRIVCYKGKTDTVANLCRYFNLSHPVIRHRLSRGWDIEKAFGEPIREYNKYLLDGFSGTLSEVCNQYNMKYCTVSFRLRKGMSFEEAIKGLYIK